MNLDNLTIKAQDTIQTAFSIAAGRDHQAVENGHILKALMEQNKDMH